MQRSENRKKRLIVTEVVNLIARGYSDDEAKDFVREKHGKSRKTADRYIAQALDILQRRTAKQRPVLVARMSAKLDAVQRMSITKRREVLGKDGEVVTLADQDLPSFVRAVEAQSRLLGLNAPEQMNVLVANANALVHELADLIGEFITDVATRRAFLEEMTRRVEARVRAKPSVIDHVSGTTTTRLSSGGGGMREEDPPRSGERSEAERRDQ